MFVFLKTLVLSFIGLVGGPLAISLFFEEPDFTFIFYVWAKLIIICGLAWMLIIRFQLLIPFWSEIQRLLWLNSRNSAVKAACLRELRQEWINNNFATILGVTLGVTCLLHPELTEYVIHMLKGMVLELFGGDSIIHKSSEFAINPKEFLVPPLEDEINIKVENPKISKPTNSAAWKDWSWILFVSCGVIAITMFTK